MRRTLLGLLLALHLAVNIDSYYIVNNPALERFFFSTTPLAAAILVYLAFSPSPQAAVEVEAEPETYEDVAVEAAPVPAG